MSSSGGTAESTVQQLCATTPNPGVCTNVRSQDAGGRAGGKHQQEGAGGRGGAAPRPRLLAGRRARCAELLVLLGNAQGVPTYVPDTCGSVRAWDANLEDGLKFQPNTNSYWTVRRQRRLAYRGGRTCVLQQAGFIAESRVAPPPQPPPRHPPLQDQVPSLVPGIVLGCISLVGFILMLVWVSENMGQAARFEGLGSRFVCAV